MDTQKAIDLIEKSEHIALLVPKEESVDCLAASEVLLRLLSDQGKLVGSVGSGPLSATARPEIFKKLSTLSPLPKEFVISLDTSQNPVSQLRYEKLEDRIEVIFSPKSSSLNEKNVSFREGKTMCDCALMVGIPDTDLLSDALAVPPEFFTETPLINIDNRRENKRYGEVNLVDDKKSSLCEMVYQFLTDFSQAPLPSEAAALLLAGVVDATRSFRAPATSAETLLAASELMRLGARIEEAFSIVNGAKNQPLSLLQLASRAAVRSKSDNEGRALWSFLTAEDFEKTGRAGTDVAPVLAHLTNELPRSPVHTLLWQDPEEQTVRALVSGERPLLDAIQTREPGEFQSPNLLILRTFPSFREAEEHLAPLLKDVLQ